MEKLSYTTIQHHENGFGLKILHKIYNGLLKRPSETKRLLLIGWS
jgi:hypothetical protein